MRITFLLTLVAVLAAGAGPTQAQLGPYMGGRGALDLSDQDWDLFRAALGDALRTGTAGTRTEWQNPATNTRGDVVVERAFERDGAPCGDVRARFIRGDRQEPRRLTFCRNPDGRWLIVQ